MHIFYQYKIGGIMYKLNDEKKNKISKEIRRNLSPEIIHRIIDGLKSYLPTIQNLLENEYLKFESLVYIYYILSNENDKKIELFSQIIKIENDNQLLDKLLELIKKE